MYKFIKVKDKDNKFDNSDVLVRVDAVTLDELFEAFGNFLKASGFYFDGEVGILEVINKEEQKNERQKRKT